IRFSAGTTHYSCYAFWRFMSSVTRIRSVTCWNRWTIGWFPAISSKNGEQEVYRIDSGVVAILAELRHMSARRLRNRAIDGGKQIGTLDLVAAAPGEWGS